MGLRNTYILLILLFSTSNLVGQYVIPDEVLVTYQASNKSLKQVLLDLSEKSEVSIAFQDEIIPVDSLVSITIRRKQLGLALDQLLKGTSVKYKNIGSSIVLVNDIYKQTKGDKKTISGVLTDQESGETLVFANVFLFDKSAGVTTNEYGFYSFTLPKGLQRIYFSYAGYQQEIREIELVEDKVLNVQLKPYNILLNEVVISDKRKSNQEEVPQSQDVLPIDKINAMLPLGGDADVVRLSQMMPGVNSGADGFGGLSVRGGSIDQNQILLDGVPIYNTNHALGLFSVFNSQIIKSATLIKGSFPARYGGMLSSVMDIRTRDGNTNRMRGDIGVGLLAMKASLEGPIGKKGSFLVAARRTFADIWIGSITSAFNDSNQKERNVDYYFYDLNAKLNFKLTDKSQIFLNFYNGKDVYVNEGITENPVDGIAREDLDVVDWNWGNTLLSMRWNNQLSKKSFLNMTLYSTKYNYRSFDHDRFTNFLEPPEATEVSFRAGLYSSSIHDVGLRFDFDYIPSEKHTIRMGGSIINHRFAPGLLIVSDARANELQGDTVTVNTLENLLDPDIINGTEFQFFFEDQMKLGKTAKMTWGLHQSVIFGRGRTYILPQPRFAFLVDKEKFSFKTGLSFVSQYLHLLTNSGLGLPADVWLPSTENVKPQTGWIANAGIKSVKENGLELGAEIYYKKLNNVVTFIEGGFLDINDATQWDQNVPRGTGQAYGLELLMNKNLGNYTWTMNYALSKTTRQFDEINGGEPFLYRFDRRHALKLSLVYKINDNTEFSTNFIYGSPNPITLPVGVRFIPGEDGQADAYVLAYEGRNLDKLPAYHRLDLGFNFYNKAKWGRWKFTIGVYNAYNKRNPYYIDVIQSDIGLNEFDFSSISVLPFLPAVSYNISF